MDITKKYDKHQELCIHLTASMIDRLSKQESTNRVSITSLLESMENRWEYILFKAGSVNEKLPTSCSKSLLDFSLDLLALLLRVTSQETKEDAARELVAVNNLYRTKNPIYNDSFGRSVQRRGLLAGLYRLEEKWNRVLNLLNTPGLEQDSILMNETVVDTIRDLIDYLLICDVEILIGKDFVDNDQ